MLDARSRWSVLLTRSIAKTCLSLMAGLVLPALASAQSQADAVAITPVVRLAGGVVVACGVKFEAAVTDGAVSGEFTLDDTTPDRQFVLSARAEDTLRLNGIVLETGGASTETLLGRPLVEPGGTVLARGVIAGFTGSDFMRSLMVGGGMLTLGVEAGRAISISLPGPFSQQVRASYINCAGDLKK
jgi:hypothetical protein